MKKTEIIPAILEKDFKTIQSKLEQVKGLVDLVQLDICDGTFVSSKTFASSGRKDSAKKLKKLSKMLNLELDMMVDFQANTKK